MPNYMPLGTASEVAAFDYRATQQGSRSQVSTFPIATGGLPLNPIGTGSATGLPAPTGWFPGPTGSINGNPSGIPIYFRNTGGSLLRRISAGTYEFQFAPAPNGVIDIWMELTTAGARQFAITKRDIATGYIQFNTITASGTTADLANGDAVAIEYIAFTVGNPNGAAGP
jgi:hypothetical protein